MYLSELDKFIEFLHTIYGLKINEISIIKNNFDYDVAMSAEI